LRPLDDAAVEPPRERRREQADRAGAPARERRRRGARGVVQLGRGAKHALARLLAHLGQAAQGSRDRRGRHPGPPRDVVDPYAHIREVCPIPGPSRTVSGASCGSPATRKGPRSLSDPRALKRASALDYLTVTDPPASSSFPFPSSAASSATPPRTALGAPSTRRFASPRPSEVSSRTTLMTWIFLSPAPSRMTSNALFSSSASAAPPAAGAPATATAAGAAAVTSN